MGVLLWANGRKAQNLNVTKNSVLLCHLQITTVFVINICMVSFPYCNLLFHLPAALFCLWSWLVYALKTATSCLNFRQKEPRGFVLQLKAHLGSLWLDVPVPLPMQTTSSSALLLGGGGGGDSVFVTCGRSLKVLHLQQVSVGFCKFQWGLMRCLILSATPLRQVWVVNYCTSFFAVLEDFLVSCCCQAPPAGLVLCW